MSTKVKIEQSGVARQTNPTPVVNGVSVSSTHDDIGRVILRPYQVRDLINTATASLTSGTAATLITGVSGAYLDLKQISLANSSSASAEVAIKDESTTVRTIEVPPTDTIHLVFDPPLKQSATGVNWIVDMEDITGTTVSIGAEFVQEV